MQCSISNSKQVTDLNSFNSGDTYLSSLGKFCSSVNIKCFPTFRSLLVSLFDVMLFVKLLLTFYLAFLAFLISHLLLTQSNSVVLNLNILAYISLLILLFMRRYANLQKHLNSFMNLNDSLLRKIFEILLNMLKLWRQ